MQTENKVNSVVKTFSIIKRRDFERHDEYRTKRAILKIYDEMAEAMCTGVHAPRGVT